MKAYSQFAYMNSSYYVLSFTIMDVEGLQILGGCKLYVRKIKEIWRVNRVSRISYCSFRNVARMKPISTQLRRGAGPCNPSPTLMFTASSKYVAEGNVLGGKLACTITLDYLNLQVNKYIGGGGGNHVKFFDWGTLLLRSHYRYVLGKQRNIDA